MIRTTIKKLIRRTDACDFDSSILCRMLDSVPLNLMFADRNGVIRYMNQSSRTTLRSIESELPVKADEVIGKSFDIFHKNPGRVTAMLADPKNLPHNAIIQLGAEKLSLHVTAITDTSGNYIGALQTWDVVTDTLALKTENANYTALLQGVARNAQALRTASAELSEVSQQMSANAEETSAQAATASAASEMVSRSLQTVAAGTEEMSASIREIARNASEATKVASSAVNIAANTNSMMAKLGESSNEVGNVIKVITSIAQQTKLLALNATIEAARAGEAGKGFAVVANEVKELAKETAKATEDISQKIEAIQHDTKSALEAIGQIGTIINQINEIQTTIAGAVEEQTATSNEMSRNVNESAVSGNEIASNIASVAQAALDTSAGGMRSLKAANALAEMATELDALVSSIGTQQKNSSRRSAK